MTAIFKNMQKESEDLQLHVDLCAERYQALETRLDQLSDRITQLEIRLDERFSKIEETMALINDKLTRSEQARNRQLITIAGSIIAVLLAALGWAVNRLI